MSTAFSLEDTQYFDVGPTPKFGGDELGGA